MELIWKPHLCMLNLRCGDLNNDTRSPSLVEISWGGHVHCPVCPSSSGLNDIVQQRRVVKIIKMKCALLQINVQRTFVNYSRHIFWRGSSRKIWNSIASITDNSRDRHSAALSICSMCRSDCADRFASIFQLMDSWPGQFKVALKVTWMQWILSRVCQSTIQHAECSIVLNSLIDCYSKRKCDWDID